MNYYKATELTPIKHIEDIQIFRMNMAFISSLKRKMHNS